MSETTFKVGDAVTWWSSFTTKRGTIVAVVPEGKRPADVGSNLTDVGMPRNHDSYVVEATPVGISSRKRHYWPRTSLLKPAAEAAA